jgi:hypothetical protein
MFDAFFSRLQFSRYRPYRRCRRPTVGLWLERLEDRTVPSTVTWINPAGGDWDTAANWDANRVPNAGDDALIDIFGITVTHSGSNSDVVHSLICNATLDLSVGLLALNAPSDVQALNLGAALTGPGDLTIAGAFTWTRGAMIGSGHTILDGTSTVSGGSGGLAPTLTDRTVDNFGTATVVDGSVINFTNDAVWNNRAGGTLHLDGSASLQKSFAGALAGVTNSGQIIKAGIFGTSRIDVPFDNKGTVDVQNGVLALQKLTNEGTFNVEADNLASFTDGSSSGTFNLAQGSRIDVTGTVNLLDGAAVSGPGTFRLTGTDNVSGSVSIDTLAVVGANLTVADAASLVGQGLNFTAGKITLAGTGSLHVHDLNMSGGSLAGSGDVTVDGVFTWTAGDMTGSGRTELSGTATLGNSFFFGTILNGWTMDNAGTATVPDGTDVLFEGNAVWNNLASGTLELDGNGSLSVFFPGQQAVVNNAGRIIKAGISGTSHIDLPLDNVGTVDVRHGVLAVARLTNDGTVNLAAGSVASFAGGSSTGAFQLAANTLLDGTGTISLLDGMTASGPGTVRLNGTVTVGGNVSIDTLALVGGMLSIVSTTSLNGQEMTMSNATVSVSGTASLHVQDLTMSSGTLLGSGDATIDGAFIWTAGNISGGGHMKLNGTATMGTVSSPPMSIAWTVDNAGTITVPASGFGISGSTWNNLAGGTVNVVQGALNLGTLNNDGTFNVSAGRFASYTRGSIGGLFNLGTGSRVDGDNASLLDGLTVSGPGTFRLGGSGGTSTVSGSVHIDTLTLFGGTLNIEGSASLDVQDMTISGFLFVQGPGDLTVHGSFLWDGGIMASGGHAVLRGTTTVGDLFGFGPIIDGWTVDNAGPITVPNGKSIGFANDAVFNNLAGGTLELDGIGSLQDDGAGPNALVNNAGLIVKPAGNGQSFIGVPLVNSGTVDVGGVLTINRPYTQTASGTLNIDIGGLTPGTQYGRLDGNGQATLDGTLSVTLVNGFSPASGNSFRVLTFGSRVGDFATLNFPDLGSLFLDPRYVNSGLTLVTTPR